MKSMDIKQISQIFSKKYDIKIIISLLYLHLVLYKKNFNLE